MKIICNNDGNNPFNNAGEPNVYFKPDSSLLKNGKPFFLPDFSENMTIIPGLVFMIERLGKGISEKFANRYWSKVTAGVAFTATDMSNNYLATGFDQSLAVGNFIGIDDISNFSFSIQDGKTCSFPIKEYQSAANITLAAISNYCTLKTGDLIFIGTPQDKIPEGFDMQARIGMRLQGKLEQDTVLDFYVR
ncbi:MAG: fumarylacetoacetate hydrolase family protein [Bacteroidaceae bacterium]|nr:fumarylacetoacetate hydrolase family protein [Bacteroidaceae bacterium]